MQQTPGVVLRWGPVVSGGGRVVHKRWQVSRSKTVKRGVEGAIRTVVTMCHFSDASGDFFSWCRC